MIKQMIKLGLLIFSTLISNTTIASNALQFPEINEQKIISNASNLSIKTLDAALHAYKWALSSGHVKNPNVLTVIDFTQPSNQKRAWLIDLKNSKILMNFYTTHAKNSGMNYATSFSNSINSDKTSLGVFTTLNAYYGKHGLSERLMGLEEGVNNNAFQRNVVIHPAPYASEQYVKANGRTGRSWGCFAISPQESAKYIHFTQNGSVIFAYAAPEEHDSVLS